jgi:lysophospholipase L1-like esterase
MKRPLTDHEYQINSGAWIPCTTSNTTDNGDNTCTITDGLDVAIPIGGLKVRVKAIGINPASTALLNTVAYTLPAARKYQLLFFGDSITGGIGTTGTGTSQTGDFNKGNDYPSKTTSQLLTAGLDVDQYVMPFPGQTAGWFNTNALNDGLKLFDYVNYTDIYCVLFFGANDMLDISDTDFRTNLTTTCSALKAAGAKVIIVPVLNRKDSFSNSNFNPRRNAFNTWIAANYATIADGVVDISAHPEMWGDSAPDNATYFNAPDTDGLSKVHPTNAGALVIANCLTPALTTLAATSSVIVSPPNEAADFVTATGITDSTQIAAINTMVADLKAAGIWWKLRAIYPFVGGNAFAHKFNLRDARDLDSCYRLIYQGAATHDANGVTWVGGAVADTKFTQNQRSAFSKGKLSLHYYSRTANPVPEGIDIGGGNGGSIARFAIRLGGQVYCELNDNAPSPETAAYTATGLFSVCRADNTGHRTLYKNGAPISTATSPVGSDQSTSTIIGNQNLAGVGDSYPSARNCAYAAIGYGLTDSEEAAHYAIVQAFQTALGRAV